MKHSTYPYVVGPTFYGQASNRFVNSVTESTTVYDGTTSISRADFDALQINVFPNSAASLIAIQFGGLVETDMTVELLDITGKLIRSTVVSKGSTITYFDVQTVYAGTYLVTIKNGDYLTSKKIIINK